MNNYFSFSRQSKQTTGVVLQSTKKYENVYTTFNTTKGINVFTFTYYHSLTNIWTVFIYF